MPYSTVSSPFSFLRVCPGRFLLYATTDTYNLQLYRYRVKHSSAFPSARWTLPIMRGVRGKIGYDMELLAVAASTAESSILINTQSWRGQRVFAWTGTKLVPYAGTLAGLMEREHITF